MKSKVYRQTDVTEFAARLTFWVTPALCQPPMTIGGCCLANPTQEQAFSGSAQPPDYHRGPGTPLPTGVSRFMRGGMEAIYDDIPSRIGFGQFAPASAARGPMFSSRSWLKLAGEPVSPAPVPESEES